MTWEPRNVRHRRTGSKHGRAGPAWRAMRMAMSSRRPTSCQRVPLHHVTESEGEVAGFLDIVEAQYKASPQVFLTMGGLRMESMREGDSAHE